MCVTMCVTMRVTICVTIFAHKVLFLRVRRCFGINCKQKSLLVFSGVQHLLHLKSKSKILRPIEIMGFFYEIFCQIQGNNLL